MQGIILRHFIALKDVHSFFVPANIYEKIFRKEWLAKKIPLDEMDLNNPHGTKSKYRMTQKDIASTESIYHWIGRYYPEARDENVKILDDYLTLCEENNIRPVMFTVPVTEKYVATFNKKLFDEFHDLIGQALSKHPDARFLDCWDWKGVTYEDFKDHSHLNIYGAAKFSTYLNDFIEQLDNGG